MKSTKLVLVLTFFGVFFAATLGASSGKCDGENPPQNSQHFFLTGNLGYSVISYSSNPTVSNFAATQQASNSSHFPLAIDIAGLLQVIDESTAIGVGFDGISDSYSTNGSGISGSVSQTGIVGTFRHYFGDAVGHGAFLRADLGVAFVSLSTTTVNGLFNTTTNTSSTFHGLFVLGGAGYSAAVSPHVSLSLEGDYARAFVSGGAIGEWQPKAGILISF